MTTNSSAQPVAAAAEEVIEESDPRADEVVRLRAKGLSQVATAKEMGLSERTIRRIESNDVVRQRIAERRIERVDDVDAQAVDVLDLVLATLVDILQNGSDGHRLIAARELFNRADRPAYRALLQRVEAVERDLDGTADTWKPSVIPGINDEDYDREYDL